MSIYVIIHHHDGPPSAIGPFSTHAEAYRWAIANVTDAEWQIDQTHDLRS